VENQHQPSSGREISGFCLTAGLTAGLASVTVDANYDDKMLHDMISIDEIGGSGGMIIARQSVPPFVPFYSQNCKGSMFNGLPLYSLQALEKFLAD
jgi:hypothetical protein